MAVAAPEKCARDECGKTVYPMDELKCMDKVWHKQCFKCNSCNTTLTLKNYKSKDRIPFCESHLPKNMPSAVADTPELRRVAEAKTQSPIVYTAGYEKQKGHKTDIAVADDPELSRHLKNQQTQSQLHYTGEVSKKAHHDKVRPNLLAPKENKAPAAAQEAQPAEEAPAAQEETA